MYEYTLLTLGTSREKILAAETYRFAKIINSNSKEAS